MSTLGTFPGGPVMVATDLSEDADEALRQADSIARHRALPLFVSHVMPARVHHLLPHFHASDALEGSSLDRVAEEAVVARVLAVTGRAREDYEVLLGSATPHGSILSQAERISAGIVVVGAGGIGRALFGGVAERVARYAHCPVLVARKTGAGLVLGATDFSDPALPAIAAAVAEADRRGVGLAVVHGLDIGASVSPELREELWESALQRLHACLESLEATGERIVVQGSPPAAIVEVASKLPAELVVVGTRGRTGLGRVALGSVAEVVVRRAPCSVLLVRLHAST